MSDNGNGRNGTVSLAARRAELTGDCTLWTPADALRSALEDIEAGTINPEQMVIHLFEETEDGRWRHHYYAAGVTHQEHVAILEMAKARALEDWRGE